MKEGQKSSQKRAFNIVVATTNGRAFYEFSNLLKKLSLPHKDILPDQAPLFRNSLVLTTKEELQLTQAKKFLLYEEMNGDFEHDSVLLISKMLPQRKDSIVVGVDPGGITGVALLYKGYPVTFRTFSNSSETLSFIEKVMKLHASKNLLRIGKGDERGRMLASEADRLASRLKAVDSSLSIKIEMVDERGTSKNKGTKNQPLVSLSKLPFAEERAIQRDALAALNIARRKGEPYNAA